MSADLDGEARDGETKPMRKHLSRCADCRHLRRAAVVLRESLAAAAYDTAEAATRDEAVLAQLRREGLCGAPHQRLVSARLVLPFRGVLSGSAIDFRRLAVQPALAATGLSFALTWGALQWAGHGQPGRPTAPDQSAGAVARAPDPLLIEKWLSGPPTLAALVRLERARPPKPSLSPIRRGAVEQRRRRLG
jgi:hypothetical protein